jgi:hypothetical protein
MRISIFLSYPKPCFSKQQTFISRIDFLKSQGFEPRTLGVTAYDMDAPLKAIRRLMIESNGLITIAFRRSLRKALCNTEPILMGLRKADWWSLDDHSMVSY